MILDLLKKSQNSKLWNFFNKRIFDLQLEKFLSPKIFLFNFDKLNIDAGCVSASATASHTIPLSSFEAELDGTTKMIKNEARIRNTADEMGINIQKPSLLYSDNLAMIKFVKGEGVAKGIRHVEMRMWYTREEFSKGNFEFEHMPGIEIPTDKMTKLGNVTEHREFTRNVLGHNLVSENFMRIKD